jgi:AraC-like DNA-binding protein
LLKERTGRSFTDLMRQCRVDLACDLLRSTEKPLAEVAAACGFCDQSYFTRVFQDVKGFTPKQFRTNSQGNGKQPGTDQGIGVEETDKKVGT